MLLSFNRNILCFDLQNLNIQLFGPFGVKMYAGSVVPANAMRNSDGTPMKNADGSYMLNS